MRQDSAIGLTAFRGSARIAGVDQVLAINLRDAPARRHPLRASIIELEPGDTRWADTGLNVRVMEPGQPSGRYHSEPNQEDFLVLYGECIAIVDEREQPLRQWDLLHCPAGTAPRERWSVWARRAR
jgi:mannose-6-phosphate isomerase-like protein (cupin superfamily)